MLFNGGLPLSIKTKPHGRDFKPNSPKSTKSAKNGVFSEIVIAQHAQLSRHSL